MTHPVYESGDPVLVGDPVRFRLSGRAGHVRSVNMWNVDVDYGEECDTVHADLLVYAGARDEKSTAFRFGQVVGWLVTTLLLWVAVGLAVWAVVAVWRAVL